MEGGVPFSNLKCRNREHRPIMHIERCQLSGHFGQEEERYRQEKNSYEAPGWQSGIAFAATKLGYLKTSAGRVKATRMFLWDSCRHGAALICFFAATSIVRGCPRIGTCDGNGNER